MESRADSARVLPALAGHGMVPWESPRSQRGNCATERAENAQRRGTSNIALWRRVSEGSASELQAIEPVTSNSTAQQALRWHTGVAPVSSLVKPLEESIGTKYESRYVCDDARARNTPESKRRLRLVTSASFVPRRRNNPRCAAAVRFRTWISACPPGTMTRSGAARNATGASGRGGPRSRIPWNEITIESLSC